MEHVFFRPWVGEDYSTGGIFKKKILVVGESHYCGNEECEGNCGFLVSSDEECYEFTNNTLKKYLSGYKDTWTPTYRKFERSLYVNEDGTTTLEDSNKIWQSIAFFNFLQVAMTKARKAGTNEDYEEGQKAFLEVIEELQPDLIIVWGVRLFEKLPGIKDGWIWGDLLEFEWNDGQKKKINNGYYQLKNEKKSRVIAVYHPSVGYSWDWWHKVIATEL